MNEDELTTLKRIADLAHAGGLVMLNEAETLAAIRRLSLPYWNKKRLTGPMQLGVLAALQAGRAAPAPAQPAEPPPEPELPPPSLMVECAQGFVEGWTRSQVRSAINLAILKQRHAQPAPLTEPTDAMVTAYMQANDAYWRRTDELASPPGQWRTGTVKEATRESLRAALAAAQGEQP